MSISLHERTVLPPSDPSSLDRLARDMLRAPMPARLIGPDGSQIALPGDLYELLKDVVDALSQGVAVTIVPTNTTLTTQEAADLLGVSRPTLVRLLADGEIPHTFRGRHRRVLLSDVLDYQRRTRKERR